MAKPKTYNVIVNVTRQVQEGQTIQVKAMNYAQAEERALNKARDNDKNINWERMNMAIDDIQVIDVTLDGE